MWKGVEPPFETSFIWTIPRIMDSILYNIDTTRIMNQPFSQAFREFNFLYELGFSQL
jgi:hypothetical protein